MAKTSRSGLSGAHRVSYGRPGRGNPAQRVPINKTGAEIKQAREKHKERIAALSFVQREAFLGDGEHDIEMADAPEYYPADGWQDMDSDDEDALQQLPPGEEGHLHSHAGKEATFHQIFDKCRPGRGDPRRRATRVQTTINAWREQIPLLTDTYLQLKAVGPLDSDEVQGGWEIEVIGFDEFTSRRFMHVTDARRTNETLLKYGYLGASPEKVSLAFPIHLFEIYRQIHRVCPRYTISSLSTTLTNLHERPRRSNLAEQLSTAYDAYLEIIREADHWVDEALNRDEDWKVKNVCAPCMYTTLNERPLRFSWMGCADGNNSLKLVDATFLAGTARPDDRTSTSFRWLSPAEVDVFKDEVSNSQKKARSKQLPTPPPAVDPQPPSTATPPREDSESVPQEDDPDVAWLNVNELSASDTEELTKCLDTCVERWKAAGPEARKKMFSLFAIPGIFVIVCRHGHLVVGCDMIRSGELMKYPLALVKWLLDKYGADIGLGYDIMCAFFKTLMRSSLGPQVTAMRMRGVVPAFHGHAHNRACQIGWHPMYVEGVGLEDFEECERTFSKSNHLAASTRLATPFHRQQQIDEHFHFHDLDKHASSGNFIYQNYRQALEKITFNAAQLSLLEQSLGTTASDYEKYHAAEVKYFASLRQEPEEVQRTIDYMERLQKYGEASAASDQAKREFKRLDYNIVNNGYISAKIAQVRTRYRTTYTKLLAMEEELCRFEEEHSIVVRWDPNSQQYKDGLSLATERKYREALTEVERLVVQRLFELTKLGMSGLAYNLRDKISKALKTRSEAIRRAINNYNEAASGLSPPRERLTFAQVIHMTSLAEFDILRDTRQDIRLLEWTQPARREAMNLHYGIQRSKEEISRLNVEITRVLTFLIDKHADYYKAIAQNLIINPSLAAELQRRWRHSARISTSICRQIASTSRMVGFSGTIFPGKRVGRDAQLSDGVPAPYWLAAELGIVEAEVEYEEPDFEERQSGDDQGESDLVVRELDVEPDGIVQLMDHLSTFDDS
ncbi:hypothetical protein R3P38DRAFT_3321519 [Favolaschia claudopus]|uniref:CxC1-like cysteine cluster associated with KDZ transposases domain-containing protein n=1 Tax=Favolaschia claudopus TaxID=2862362 RepID=A0AAW0ASD3_9AGAR